MADNTPEPTLEEALRWLDSLDAANEAKATGTWPLASILDHLAQSIEMSLDGFPQPRSAFFRATVGPAAFRVFKWRGRMSHGLDAAIPGAPPLAPGPDWKPAAQRLRRAIGRFQSHAGELKPHFAYGAMSKSDYAMAHGMHVANHRSEIRIS